ncbi:RtcB family protein, partial [Candidatus Woesearchaeota archaeon]|nr:RtcB family protein [Candidatus Woesearchaeota archaeon]
MWELPISFKKGMRVPARIVASKKLMDNMDQGVFDQISNVATLPGIQKYAYCMPDGHWGYGFCVSPETRILTEFGYFLPIEKFREHLSNLKCYNKEDSEIINTKALRFMKIRPKNKVLRLTTK